MGYIVILDLDKDELKALEEALPVMPLSEILREKIKQEIDNAKDEPGI